MLKWMLPAAAGTMLLAATAYGQAPEVYKGRLEPEKKNVGLCNELDTTMRREHTVTVTGNTAKVTGSGGVSANMKQISPRVFEANSVQMGANQFKITADVSKTPGSLLITDNRLGCRYSGALAKSMAK